MSPTSSRTLALLCAATLLVGGANLGAYAATGSPLLLGRSNTAARTTTLANDGSGPALRLETRPKAAPVAVTSTRKVARLNADRVDGLEGEALRSAAWRYEIPAGGPYASQVFVSFPDLPDGLYLASYSILTSTDGNGTLCYFMEDKGVLTAQGMSRSVDKGAMSTNNATTLVDSRSGPVQVYCLGAFSFLSEEGDTESSVSFVRVDSTTAGTVEVATP